MLINQQKYAGTLKFLGRSSAFGPNGNTAAYYIDEGENYKNFILIDCGYDVYEKLIHKFDFGKFDQIFVFITHLHPDHSGSLGQLIFYIYYVHHKIVNVISNCSEIERYLELCGVSHEQYRYGDYPRAIQSCHVTTMDSYGFIFLWDNKTIVYTGDTRSLEPFEKATRGFSYVDELYTEASIYGGVHLNIAENLERLLEIQERGTKVYLMHLDDEEAIAKITNNRFEFVEIV